MVSRRVLVFGRLREQLSYGGTEYMLIEGLCDPSVFTDRSSGSALK